MSFIDSTVEAIDQRIAHTQDEIAQLQHVRTILLREGNPAKRIRAPKKSAKPANGSRGRKGSRPSPEIDSAPSCAWSSSPSRYVSLRSVQRSTSPTTTHAR